ncbi:MAG: HAD-superfamily hydrolase, subfamily variant 1 [Deltaproteobacteria bacterium]|nr:HAD-superfamily hydrolase, subfamily variant 1 [Deltaproteobacteria bacterium]
MNASKVRGVIFDLDGTLIDSYQAIYLGFHHAYSEMGLPPLSYEQVQRAVGRGLGHTFRELLGEEKVPQALSLFRKKYEEIFRAHTHLLPDVREVVGGLQCRGIQLAVATNKLGRFSRAIFEHFGMEKMFAVILGDGDVSQNKPDPEMLYQAMDNMRLAKEETVFVGDSVIDIQAGKNAGVRVFAVPTGNTDRADLVKAQPTVIMNRLLDLLSLV